jgi:hypothetical protein
MDSYDLSLAVMDDDGAGSAITSTPVQVRDLPDPVHHGDIFSRIEASTAGEQ